MVIPGISGDSFAGIIGGMTEEEEEELYKDDLKDPENHSSVIIHLDPNIWSLKSNGP